MNRIAIYSRKSKETDTGESIKNQIDMCKAYFNREDVECTFEIFQDEGFSGGNINRPSFQRMIELAKHRQFDIVAVYKVDRIARNIVDFVNIYDELERHDVKLVSITEGFDPSTPIGKMMMMMLASFAEMERMNIAQRVKDNMNALAKMGRWSGGTPPTGYKSKTININGKKEVYLELVEEKKLMINTIFKKASDGYTTYQIGELLSMPPKTVANIISNPTYVCSDEMSANYLKSIGYNVFGELNGNGYLVYNRRPKKKGKKLFNAKGMFVAVSEHKPIVDSKTWIIANKNLKERATENKPRISPQSFLAHLVKCSCGSGMYITPGNAKKDGTRNFYFVCSKKKSSRGEECNSKWLRVDFVEKSILNTLEKIHLNPKSLENYLKQKNSSIDYTESIKEVKQKLSKNNDKIDNLTEKLVLLDGAAIEIISKKINEIANENNKLNETLLDLERKKMFLSIDGENLKMLINTIDEFLNRFDKIDITAKQNFAQSILESVTWNSDIVNAKGKQGRISLKFLG
ncbi:recombinase family protein [Clostridium botulinum]|uniref:recombinase family protein n=1 Tax=Clostridium botulinum TaxID=1491 RepID=UPI00069BA0DC|nr:recombinase family protein [Clostridium botulinum]KOA94264.1 resolvase [Clostridium botulinum]MCD3204022.1 recombinase family protein [Clostridium botulinum C/D]MCD3222274.1 recombinase family protein [Clostridium botulinum C/D]MCD3232069.1 recombinase family protein [Clostridium botulinum C/D]MCD3273047.1 recombinase family protein [Clostridium botulinum C/D]